MAYQPLEIARVTHEAVRALQNVLGNPHPSEPWDALSLGERDQLAYAVQQAATAGAPDPDVQHARWMAHKTATGWAYGPVKDEVARTHPNLVPYGQLPAGEQDKDRLFLAIVQTLASPPGPLPPGDVPPVGTV